MKLSAFGDIIHALPALDDILAQKEVSQVHWLVDSRFTFATEVLPEKVTVHQIALKGKHPISEIFRCVKKLRKEKFDFALDFQGLIKSSVLARLICSKVYGFSPQVIREKPASWFEVSSKPHPDEKTIVQQVRRVAQTPWLSQAQRSKPIAYIAPQVHKTFTEPLVEEVVSMKPWVVFNLGGSFATKELPDATWLDVGAKLKQQGFSIVLCWGNEKEQKKAQDLSKLGLGHVLSKRLNTPELCVFLRESDAVVAADTGILHLASAMGTKTVSFWGPTPCERNAPHSEHDVHVESNPECGPCIKKTCDDFICMDMIQAEEIVAGVTQLEG